MIQLYIKPYGNDALTVAIQIVKDRRIGKQLALLVQSRRGLSWPFQSRRPSMVADGGTLDDRESQQGLAACGSRVSLVTA